MFFAKFAYAVNSNAPETLSTVETLSPVATHSTDEDVMIVDRPAGTSQTPIVIPTRKESKKSTTVADEDLLAPQFYVQFVDKCSKELCFFLSNNEEFSLRAAQALTDPEARLCTSEMAAMLTYVLCLPFPGVCSHYIILTFTYLPQTCL